jgi:uncharacterized damage-inducible protein DinB
MTDEALRYPVGRMAMEARIEPGMRVELIAEIEALPSLLSRAVEGIGGDEWEARYRSEGWTVGQLVHHLADSHLHFYVRAKLALTEETPSVRPYDEGAWAELPDVAATPPGVSLRLIEALHRRLVDTFRRLEPERFARTLHHPEEGWTRTLDQMLAVYAWHGRHHLAHIELALGRRRKL